VIFFDHTIILSNMGNLRGYRMKLLKSWKVKCDTPKVREENSSNKSCRAR
jgi:hypothetical protein